MSHCFNCQDDSNNKNLCGPCTKEIIYYVEEVLDDHQFERTTALRVLELAFLNDLLRISNYSGDEMAALVREELKYRAQSIQTESQRRTTVRRIRPRPEPAQETKEMRAARVSAIQMRRTTQYPRDIVAEAWSNRNGSHWEMMLTELWNQAGESGKTTARPTLEQLDKDISRFGD